MDKYIIKKIPLLEVPGLTEEFVNKLNSKVDVEKLNAFVFDICSYLKNELRYIEKCSLDAFKILSKNNIFNIKRPSVLEREGVVYCVFKNEARYNRFIEELDILSSKFIELNNRAEYLLEFGPNKFAVKANLLKYNEMDFLSLHESIQKVLPTKIEDLTFKNINKNNIDVNIEGVHQHIINTLASNAIKRDFSGINHFYNFYKFEEQNPKFKFMKFAKSKASLSFEGLFDKHWHNLGDANFINSISNELDNYFINGSYYASKFVADNHDFFIQFKEELRDEIFEMLENTTPAALLFENEQYKNMFKHFEFINDNILNNRHIFNKSLTYRQLCNENGFLPHQKLFFDNVCDLLDNNDIKCLSDFKNMSLEKFFFLFDPNRDKKHYNLFVESEDKNIKVIEFINSFKDGYFEGLKNNSLYNAVFNSTGGFFLILFDCIRIIDGKSYSFDIYKKRFASDKLIDVSYQKRLLSHVFFIYSILFPHDIDSEAESLIGAFFNDKTFGLENITYEHELSKEDNDKRLSDLNILLTSLYEQLEYWNEVRVIIKRKPEFIK